jgi:hypothetical protein
MEYRDSVVTNTYFRFVTYTEVFVLPRKLSSTCHIVTNKSLGVVFQDNGGADHERHAGGFDDTDEV